MADLADLSHFYGQDIQAAATGDIAVATKSQRTIQRIIRRLLTNPTDANGSDYPWQPEYGVGLGEYIGNTGIDTKELQGVIRSQLLLEVSVAKSPAPTVDIQPITNGYAITVTYYDQSGLPKTFNFNLVP